METQQSVAEWARSVGIAASPARHVSRANEEMAEALTAIIENDRTKAAVEMADTVICLMVAASALGVNLQNHIDAKMEINRKREWRVDESGCAYHVK